MGQNSKAKRDKKKKQRNSPPSLHLSENDIATALIKLFDPLKLTSPKTTNEEILKFCKKISSEPPVFIKITPELWCRQSCCDSNVKEYIKLHGGKLVCGYKIWHNDPNYIEGERHAVWYKDGIFKDVTFNADGEESVLFVPDKPELQHSLEANTSRIRWGKDRKTKLLIEHHEHHESMRLTYQMSPEESWNTMLTYENWLNGERMSTIQEVVL